MPTTKWAPVCDTTLGLISIFEALTATALAALPAGQAESVYTSRRWQCCCDGHDIKDIRVVRAELQQFDAKQRDFAVRFHTAVVDANLRAASEGHDDPISEKVSQCALKIWPPAFGIQDAAAVRYDAFFAKRH
jgi:hypothetical protein